MAQYDRPPKAKAIRPDEFISFFDHLVRYFEIHQNKFFILILAVLLGFAVFGVYQYQTGKKLDGMAVAYLEAEQASGEAALPKWEAIIQSNPSGELKNLALLQIGGIQADTGAWAKASEAFEKASQSRSKVVSGLGELSSAISMENAKQCDKAQAIYEKLSAQDSNPFRFEGKLGMARCLIANGKADKAEGILYELIANSSGANPAIKGAALTKLEVLKLQATATKP